MQPGSATRVAAWATFAATCALVTTGVGLHGLGGARFGEDAVLALGFTGLGALVLSRDPRNRAGWICLTAVLAAVAYAAQAYADAYAGADVAGWLGQATVGQHDVVSHAIGVLVMQAGAALVLRQTDPGRARQALDVVRATATDTLEEFDRLVAVVGDCARREVPALHALIDRMRAAGLAVSLRVDGRLGKHAEVTYRIVQEGLTNALRHASGAIVRVEVAASDDGLWVEVVDDGPGPGPATHARYGLVGLAERVHGLGGELTTGPGPEGRGFRVEARLPVLAGTRP